jgi:hypothetical protein
MELMFGKARALQDMTELRMRGEHLGASRNLFCNINTAILHCSTAILHCSTANLQVNLIFYIVK